MNLKVLQRLLATALRGRRGVHTATLFLLLEIRLVPRPDYFEHPSP